MWRAAPRQGQTGDRWCARAAELQSRCRESVRMKPAAGSRVVGFAYLLAPLTVLTGLFLAPLAVMVAQSVLADTRGGFTLAHYARFFGDSYYLSGLLATFGVALLVTAITVVASYPLAYTYWRASRRLRAVLVILLLSPFYANVV